MKVIRDIINIKEKVYIYVFSLYLDEHFKNFKKKFKINLTVNFDRKSPKLQNLENFKLTHKNLRELCRSLSVRLNKNREEIFILNAEIFN